MDAASFGVIVADVIGEPMDLRRPPKSGGLTSLNSLTLTTGGSACNVSIAMAKLGASVAAAGLVGDDILGRAIVERLKTAGVDTSAVFITDRAQTSATIVAVDSDGQHRFFHAPGVTPLVDAETFRRCFPIFRECAFVHIGYFGLLPGLVKDLPQLLVELKQTAPGTKLALDTLNPPDDWKLLKPILPHLDIFCPSRPEAEALSGQTTRKRMTSFFRKQMNERALIGIKLDADGCYLDDGSESVLSPAYETKVIDTTGAGDTWFAGLLVALRQQMPLKQAAKFANRTAADSCAAVGASAGVKSFQETLARL
jgi:sugar/nucleoside kinase (ribokinase family)